MDEFLIDLLETFKYPVIRQGSMPPEQIYPDTFFTFWNNNHEEHSAYDNDTSNTIFDFDVNVYSCDTDKVFELLESARTLLKQNGWIITRMGYDVASDEITHIGKGMEVTFLQQL